VPARSRSTASRPSSGLTLAILRRAPSFQHAANPSGKARRSCGRSYARAAPCERHRRRRFRRGISVNFRGSSRGRRSAAAAHPLPSVGQHSPRDVRRRKLHAGCRRPVSGPSWRWSRPDRAARRRAVSFPDVFAPSSGKNPPSPHSLHLLERASHGKKFGSATKSALPPRPSLPGECASGIGGEAIAIEKETRSHCRSEDTRFDGEDVGWRDA